jgi:catalase
VTDDLDLGARLIESFDAIHGVHAGHRTLHAKGVLCSARFTGLPAGAGLSRAVHFGGETLRAHVRFSNGSGDPDAPDTSQDGRGLALKVYLPDGATTDIVALTLPVFFVRTPEDLLELNRARTPDPETREVDLTKVGAFLGDHPEAMTAITALLSAPAPESYARLAYHAIHAYRFVAADGTRRDGRYHFVPEAGESSLSDASGLGADYLAADLAGRLEAGSVVFFLEVELADPGDPIDDPTAVWGDGRERLRVGRLEVDALAFDRDRGDDVLVFDPVRVTDGIELNEDPILLARPLAYDVSVARRIAGRGDGG